MFICLLDRKLAESLKIKFENITQGEEFSNNYTCSISISNGKAFGLILQVPSQQRAY